MILTGTVALRRVARVGTHGLCVRCVKGYSIVILTGTVALRRVARVGTHGLCVRCIKGYSIEVLTGTDAQTVRPYRVTSRCTTTDAQIVRPYTRYSSRSPP